MYDADIQNLVKLVSVNSDMESFEKLYFHYYKKFFTLAKFYTKSVEGAEEIVNDAFVSIWANRSQLGAVNNFTYYTYKIVKNKCLNHLAKITAVIYVDIEDVNMDIPDIAPNKEEQLEITDLTIQINNAISKLPEQCGLVFKLVKEDGFKHKEVAELLNISVRTVEYHMSTALKKLAESLKYYPKTLAHQKQ